tara:strand:+ start:88 stop:390 length:303 start_codon:yes stop_codon:yes gene_type:complete
MRINENKLRRIIRNIILEDDLMRSRLSPIEKTGNVVDDTFDLMTLSKDEEVAINDIITMPIGTQRDKRITEFGYEKYYAKCEVLGINPEEQYSYRLSFPK